jgi:hypothetical protein
MTNTDIVIVREGNCYRLLHGHLRLTSELTASSEVSLSVKGEGEIPVIKTRGGYLVGKEGQRLPLLRN